MIICHRKLIVEMYLAMEVVLVTIQARMMVTVVKSARNNQTIQMFKLVAKLSYQITLLIALKQIQNLAVQIKKSRATHTQVSLSGLIHQILCYKIKRINLSRFIQEIPKKLLKILRTISLEPTISQVQFLTTIQMARKQIPLMSMRPR